jgi:hypothetical protein
MNNLYEKIPLDIKISMLSKHITIERTQRELFHQVIDTYLTRLGYWQTKALSEINSLSYYFKTNNAYHPDIILCDIIKNWIESFDKTGYQTLKEFIHDKIYVENVFKQIYFYNSPKNLDFLS